MNDQKIKLYEFLENNNPSQNFHDLEIKTNMFFKNIDNFKITDEKYVFQTLDQSSLKRTFKGVGTSASNVSLCTQLMG